jgi:hypothetical protein
MEKKIAGIITKNYNVNCIANDIKSDMTTYGDSMEEFDDYWREVEMSLNTRLCKEWELATLKTLVKNQIC